MGGACARVAVRLRQGSGQMAVELAALIPVVIVVALAVYNLGRYVALCATFDRVSLDAVLSQGVAPAGEATGFAAVEQVRTCIEETLAAGSSCVVEVGIVESATPWLTRFRCTLLYRPLPQGLSIAGVALGAPPTLVHEREIVVGRYRPGVVV